MAVKTPLGIVEAQLNYQHKTSTQQPMEHKRYWFLIMNQL